MSISNDLMLAILAFDSYNRCYGQNIVVDQDQIGNAVVIDQSFIIPGATLPPSIPGAVSRLPPGCAA